MRQRERRAPVQRCAPVGALLALAGGRVSTFATGLVARRARPIGIGCGTGDVERLDHDEVLSLEVVIGVPCGTVQ